MKPLSTERKVGIFAIIVLILLSYMTFKVGNIELFKKRGYKVYVYFSNLAGVDKKSKVKISGVDAGIVDDIALEEGRVKVKVLVNEGIKLYSDATAIIQFTGLLGDKFLELRPGSKLPLLRDGDTLANAVEPMDMNSLIENFSRVSVGIAELSSNLNEVLEPQESKRALRETIQNLQEVSRSLNTAVAHNDKRLKAVLDNIDELTRSLQSLVAMNKESFTSTMANLRDFSTSLKSEGPTLVSNLNRTTQELKEVISENRAPLRSTLERMDAIGQKLESGQGTLGRLINDEGLSTSLESALEGMNKTMSAVERFRAFLTVQGEYLSRPKDAKGYVYVTLQPKPEHSFILGVVSDPVGRITSSDGNEKKERKTEFTTQYAYRFVNSSAFKNTALRAGVTENRVGVGADQFFLNDRAKLSVDAWDFGRDDPGSKNPRVKIGADYFLFKSIFVTGGVDDLMSGRRRGAYVGGGVKLGN